MQSKNSKLVARLVFINFHILLAWSFRIKCRFQMICQSRMQAWNTSESKVVVLFENISPMIKLLVVSRSKMTNAHERSCIHRWLNCTIHKYIHTCINTHIHTYIQHPSLPCQILAPLPTSYQMRCCCMFKTPR